MTLNHNSNKESPNVLAVIQARMSSSRLPGKVLLDISGQPMLIRVIERTRKAKKVSGIIVATTNDPTDNAIESLCQERGYLYYRGNMHDVLDRYYQTALTFQADLIVRITADCPLMDPDIVDKTISVINDMPSSVDPDGNILFAQSFDFVANRLPPPWYRTYPIGLDVEVCTFHALERAWKEADQPFQREHVMPYLYEGITTSETYHGNSLQSFISHHGFRVGLLNHEPDYGQLRLTVDTPADLDLICRIFEHFPGQDHFSWLEVISLIENEPDLVKINADIQPKLIYETDQRNTNKVS